MSLEVFNMHVICW